MELPTRPRTTMPSGRQPHHALSTAFVRNVARAGRYCDGDGLYLDGQPTATRSWVHGWGARFRPWPFAVDTESTRRPRDIRQIVGRPRAVPDRRYPALPAGSTPRSVRFSGPEDWTGDNGWTVCPCGSRCCGEPWIRPECPEHARRETARIPCTIPAIRRAGRACTARSSGGIGRPPSPPTRPFRAANEAKCWRGRVSDGSRPRRSARRRTTPAPSSAPAARSR